MAVSIRPARMSDAGEIARLTTQLGYELDEPTAAARLSRILQRRDHRFLIAEVDGRAVGWLDATIAEYVEADPCVAIAGLVVDRSHRRRGIGRKLMEEAEDWASRQKCSVVRLWSSAGRTGAHRFYERLGYANIKTQYSFAKPLDSRGQASLSSLVPRIDQ